MEKIHSVKNPLRLIAHHTAFLQKKNYTARRCSVGIFDAYQAVDFVLKKYKVDRLFLCHRHSVGCRSPPFLTF